MKSLHAVALLLVFAFAPSAALAQRWDEEPDPYGDEYGEDYYEDEEPYDYGEDYGKPDYEDDFDGATLGGHGGSPWRPFQSGLGLGLMSEKNDNETILYGGIGQFHLRQVRARGAWPIDEAAFLDRISAFTIFAASVDSTRDTGTAKFDLSGQFIQGEIDVRVQDQPFTAGLEFGFNRLSVYDVKGPGVIGAEGDTDGTELIGKLGYYTSKSTQVFLEIGQESTEMDLRFSTSAGVGTIQSEPKGSSRGLGFKAVLLQEGGRALALEAAFRMATEKDAGVKSDSSEFELDADYWIDPRFAIGASASMTSADDKNAEETGFGLELNYNTPTGIGIVLELDRAMPKASGVKDETTIQLTFSYRF